MTRKTGRALTISVAVAALTAGMASAQDYGSFPGCTLRVKLIGGAQNEPLYATIADWEAVTGALHFSRASPYRR
jgi:multiple sugar transport system substrate-binding protein